MTSETIFNVPQLIVEDLAVFRGDYPVFTHLSFSLSSGQWAVIRGRNGSGKSTLLKAIVGLITPDQGHITHTDFCYLGHQNGFREYLTVGEHLTFIACYFNAPCTTTPVDSLYDIPLHHLSAGLKRQVALCQFILSPHKLWIMDEPFEHLDKHAQTDTLTRMQSHIHHGGAILQTSHEDINIPGIQEIWLG